MIRNESIVCFAHDWVGDPTSKTHIMRILSEKNRILWVNSIGMRRPAVSGRDARRLLAKLGQLTRGLVRVNANLHVVSPLAVPLPGVPGMDRLNATLVAGSIRHFARRAGLTRPILWTFLPNTVGLVGRLGESRVIYHCVDEYSAFAGVPRDALRRMEQALVRRADLVLASSETLAAERRSLNPRTHFVSHGVDVAHFAQALDATLAPPADAGDLPRPVVGFFGLIAEWIDLELLAEIARRRPSWTVVMIGKATVDTAPLRALPNVRLLGQKPYAMLPAYCRAFDVGLIPFRVDALTVRANPLKLREYLAAGLPVVSSDLPEVRKYAGLARLATGVDEFVAAIEAALADRGETAARSRLAAMAHESWEARVEQISELIDDAWVRP
ncbi:MAG TPA: glycosyltransferase [Methylomirabilota bacterium]|jgi:glycosyltransferase involved in cell wall biosynthesis